MCPILLRMGIARLNYSELPDDFPEQIQNISSITTFYVSLSQAMGFTHFGLLPYPIYALPKLRVFSSFMDLNSSKMLGPNEVGFVTIVLQSEIEQITGELEVKLEVASPEYEEHIKLGMPVYIKKIQSLGPERVSIYVEAGPDIPQGKCTLKVLGLYRSGKLAFSKTIDIDVGE